MTKINWDKVNREKHGPAYGGPVVGSSRPINTGTEICKFYSISKKKHLRKCKKYVSSLPEHDGEFCSSHQGVVFHSEERGWRVEQSIEKKKAAERRKQKEFEKNERMLEYQAIRRKGR